MANLRIPRIEEFPRDNLYWRVDWVGALLPNPEITTEPHVQIVISPFFSDPNGLRPDGLSSVRATDLSRQKVIKIGVGQLPLINVGSVWKDGLHIGLFAGKGEIFTDLQINPKSVKEIPALHKDSGWSVIPYSHYRVGKAGAGSLLIAVNYEGDPYGILIPAMELIRFYYAVSTNLAHAVFSGAFQHSPDSVINAARTWYREEDDRVFLGLRQQITDDEGWFIARILRSKQAAESCRHIYDSLLKEIVNKKYIHVPASFPFHGSTNLQAKVKKIPGPDGQWRNLVLSLEQCTAPLPFSELTIIRDNDGSKANPETDIPNEKKKAYRRNSKPSNDKGDLQLQSQNDTNAALSTVIITAASGRLSVLNGRKPDKPTKEQCEYRSAGLLAGGFAVEALGTGQGGYGQDEKNTQKANVVPGQSSRKAAAPSFDLFIEAIECLNQKEGVMASIREVGFALAYMPLTKPSDRWQWGYLDSASRKKRSVIIADIYVDGRFFNLIEFQQREKERYTVCLAYTGEAKVADSDLYRLLHECSLKTGVWKNIDLAGFGISSLKHTWGDSSLFGDSVISRVF